MGFSISACFPIILLILIELINRPIFEKLKLKNAKDIKNSVKM